jgi:hypothetical protein
VHHLWLDLANHGLPVRIKLEDVRKNQAIDVSLTKKEAG